MTGPTGQHLPELRTPQEQMFALITRAASDPTFDPEKLHRLLDFQERIMEDQRKTAFAAAMVELQADMPMMDKLGRADKSRYAKLEDMHAVMQPLLAKHGFSHAFREEAVDEKSVRFSIAVRHKHGHSEKTELTVPVDVAAMGQKGPVRNAVQDAGSTVSYARRYLIKMAYGIVEKGEDTDGQSTKPISPEQAFYLESLLKEAQADLAGFLKYMEVDAVPAILGRNYQKAKAALEAKKRGMK